MGRWLRPNYYVIKARAADRASGADYTEVCTGSHCPAGTRKRVGFEEQLAMLAALGRAVASACLFENARHFFELMPKNGNTRRRLV